MRDDLDDLFGGLERASVRERPQPFKFLDPYGPEDRAIFFGRESETAILYAQFYKSRLTLVYGESGTGKTSLIDCGVTSERRASCAFESPSSVRSTDSAV